MTLNQAAIVIQAFAAALAAAAWATFADRVLRQDIKNPTSLILFDSITWILYGVAGALLIVCLIGANRNRVQRFVTKYIFRQS